MRLRNKRTGEIGLVHCDATMFSNKIGVFIDNNHIDLRNPYKIYTSLAELNEEWEDAPEEPKVGYIIDPMEEDCVSADDSGYEEPDVERAKELGIWFATKEEAELVVRKLKAWKRLKDKGFRFKDYTRNFDGFNRVDGSVFIVAELDDEGTIGMIDELHICFGGENE